MTRAAIYLRLSSDRTGDEAGVNRQREDCERLAELRGFDVVQVESDNDTSAAGKKARPGFERILAAIESEEIEVVLSWSLDRLTRNRRDTLRLIEAAQTHNVTLALVRGADLDMSTPGGRLMADLFASIARNEIEVKGDRQRRANRQRAEAGKPHKARRAFGYEPDGMQVREDEAEIVRDMVARFLAGWSVREIARDLNEREIGSTEGKQFTPKVVRDHITSKRNAGIRVYDGREFDGVWQPIIDRQTHDRVMAEVDRRTGERVDRAASRKYLLAGLLYCGRCGGTMAGHQRKDRKTQITRPKYECPTYSHGTWCGRNSRLSAPLEFLIREATFYRLDTPVLGQLLSVSNHPDIDAARLQEDQRTLQNRLDALVDDYADGTLSKPEFVRAKSRIAGELAAVEDELGTYFASQNTASLLHPGESVRATWERQTDGWRRRLLGLLIDRVTVHPSRKLPLFQADETTYRFDPNSIEIHWIV